MSETLERDGLIQRFCDTYDCSHLDAVRFLTARNFNYEAACDQYGRYRKWREDNHDRFGTSLTGNIDDVCDIEEDVLTIHLVPIKNEDRTNVFWSIVSGIEVITRSRDRFTLEIDASKASLLNIDVKLISSTVKVLSDYYPERTQKIIIKGLSFVFRWVWNIVSLVIDERTRSKITFE